MYTLRSRCFLFTLLSVFALTALKADAQQEPVENGGFETQDFTGWTVVLETGSTVNWFVHIGNSTPESGFPFLTPPDSEFAAISDQNEN
jgi:hypothetical protein